MDQSTIALLITAVTLVLFITQVFPIPVTALLAALAMALTGVISFADLMSQFGTPNMFSIIGMMVLGGALFETGVADKLGQDLLGRWKDNENLFIVVLIIVVTICSSFLTMITTTAMFLPVVEGVAKQSDGKISVKKTYMAVGIAATLGGCGTLLAFPSQSGLINTLLAESGNQTMGFFYGMRGMLIGIVVMILYFLTVGKMIEEKTFNFKEPEEKSASHKEKEADYKTWKMVFSSVVVILVILSIATGVFTNGVAALLGSAALVVTGCIDLKTALGKIHWDVVLLAGCLFAFANGFNTSGASEICVNTVLNIFGANASSYVIFALILFCAVVLTNVLDNVATAALLAPIALSLSQQFGMNATSVLFGVLMACNIAYATPISCPCISMTLSGGYRFNDYLRFGGPLSVIMYLLVILIIPLIYGI